MDLRQRKRINNIPKFNSGTGSLYDSVNGIGGDITGLNQYKTKITLIPIQSEINNMRGPGKITMGLGSNAKPTAGQVISQAGNIVGGAFDQSSKFTNGTSKSLGQFGDLVSKIPGPYGQAIGGVFKLASNYSGMANYSHDSSEMMNQAGTTESSINGIGYTRQNVTDTKAAYNDVSKTGLNNTISSTGTGAATGAAIGSIIPGLGTVAGGIIGGIIGGIGSLFGAGKARRRQNRIGRNAIIQTDVINSANMASADTVGLENNYYANNYDTTGGILYANRGKDLKLRKRINRAKV